MNGYILDSDVRPTTNQSPMRNKTTLSEKRELKLKAKYYFILLMYF